VLITGASYSIGQTIAISFTQAKASTIVLAARGHLTETVSAIEKAANAASIPIRKILPLNVDVTDAKSVEAAAEQVKIAFPDGIDIVVSNAAGSNPTR